VKEILLWSSGSLGEVRSRAGCVTAVIIGGIMPAHLHRGAVAVHVLKTSGVISGTAALFQPAARIGTPMSDPSFVITIIAVALTLATAGLIAKDRRRSWLLLMASLALAAGAVLARVVLKYEIFMDFRKGQKAPTQHQDCSNNGAQLGGWCRMATPHKRQKKRSARPGAAPRPELGSLPKTNWTCNTFYF
jgi:hypothetical protein